MKVLSLLGRVLHAKGQSNACLGCFGTLVELVPGHADTYCLIGKV